MLDPGRWLQALPDALSLLWVAALPAGCFTDSLYTRIRDVLGRMWRKEIFSAVEAREIFFWGTGHSHACEYRGGKTVKAPVDGRTERFLHFASQHEQQRQTPPICWAQQHHWGTGGRWLHHPKVLLSQRAATHTHSCSCLPKDSSYPGYSGLYWCFLQPT